MKDKQDKVLFYSRSIAQGLRFLEESLGDKEKKEREREKSLHWRFVKLRKHPALMLFLLVILDDETKE